MIGFLTSPVTGPMWTYYLLALIGASVACVACRGYYHARLAAKDESIALLIRVSCEHAPAAKALVRELQERRNRTLGPNARLSDTLDTFR